MSDAVISDKVLITRYQNGDELALETLIKRYQEKIYTTIYFLVKDRTLADDLFQDTFIKVLGTLRQGRYQHEGKFGSWVARIAYNLCIDHFRKKKRGPNTNQHDIGDMTSYLRVGDAPNAEDDLIRNQTCARVRKLIDELPPEQKEVVILRHYADLSFKEIARITGVSINTALGRMRYALQNMRKVIQEKAVTP